MTVSPLHGLGRAVRSRRTQFKLSQQQLGTRTGMHRNYVGAIERGEINPTMRTLIRLAGGLNTTPSTLLRLGEDCTAELEVLAD